MGYLGQILQIKYSIPSDFKERKAFLIKESPLPAPHALRPLYKYGGNILLAVCLGTVVYGVANEVYSVVTKKNPFEGGHH